VGWNPLLRTFHIPDIISGPKSENICREQISLGRIICLVEGEVKNVLKEK